jgi:CheY-like chemotaxis protein
VANAKVLVVDDDPAVLRMLTSALTTLGYEVAAAPGARQALEVAKNLPAGPDLVISDVLMPDMDGAELIREMARLCPSTAALFISGNAGQVRIPAGAPFLQKPFSLEALAAKIREVLEPPDRRCGCA